MARLGTLVVMFLWAVMMVDRASVGAAVPSRTLMVEIEESLVCQCGCGLTVHACNHLNCPSAIPMREEIGKRLARGETREQVLAYFHDRYGEKVLSAPMLSGFSLVAWVAPGLAVILGTVAVGAVVRRWARQTRRQAEATGPPPAADDAYRERLAKELKEFDA